jgi:PAS domain S-box-containing protein
MQVSLIDSASVAFWGLTGIILDGCMDEAFLTRSPDSQFFLDVFNASPIGIAVENLDGQPLFVNPAFCSFLGFSAEELCNKHCVDFSPPEDAEKDWALFQQLRSGAINHYQLDKRYFRRDGSSVWGRLTLSLVNSRSTPLVLAMVEDITDKKAAEETRFRHTAIVDSSDDAIISKDLNAVITTWNVGAERMFGYKEAEIVGQPITVLIPPELRDEENRILGRLRTEGRIEHYETKRVTKTGKIVDVSLTINSVVNSDGRIVGFTKIAQDITKRKQAEEELRESEARFRLIADTAPVLIWMSGTDKLCTYFNKPWLDFTGRSTEQELGNGWAEGVHSDDLKRCLDTYTESFERREKFRMEYRLRRHDGEYRWVLDIGVPRFSPDRSFAGYIGIAVDITENKEAERVVRESEERLRLASQLGGMFAYSWNAATDVIERSGESEKILGVKAEEVSTGAAISAMVHPDDKERLDAALATLSLENPILHITYRIVRPDGAVKWLERNSRAYFDAKGNVERMAGLILDVTTRKLAEQALANMSRKLIESQEDERSRIGRELHDDINQQLGVVAIELDQLCQVSSNDKILCNEIRKAQQRVSEICSDVHRIAHQLHSGKLEYLGLVSAARSFSKEISEKNNVQIDFKEEGVPRILPHEVALSLFRILQEALHNAVAHSGAKHFEVALWEESSEVHLRVKDFGKGFDPLAVMHGEGIGLTSMRERVRLVNGTISINSKPSSGTTIYVRVPLPESWRDSVVA